MMNQRTSPLVAGLVPLNGSWGRLSHAALGSRGWGWLEPLAAEAFLAVLRPEERASVSFASDFLEGFTGFASNSSLSDVLSPTRGEAFLRLFTPLALPGTASLRLRSSHSLQLFQPVGYSTRMVVTRFNSLV
jgi:hypothetical protein